MSYFNAIRQNVIPSYSNSSTTNLTKNPDAGYQFLGTADSTLGVAGIQVSLKTDQNCRITIEQSPDTTPNWDIVDEYYYSAGESFGVTVQAVNSYVRVTVTNISTTTATTYFRLQTALCPIVEAVPRSLDSNGNLKVSMGTDGYGFEAENSPMGDQRVVEPVRLVGSSFEGTTIDGNFWTTASSGTGSISQANAQLTLTSGANTSVVTAYSLRRARYIGGSGIRYRAVIQQGASQSNNTRSWGIGWGASMPTITDGAWFQLDSGLNLVVMKGNSATTITNGTFNGSLGSSYSLSTTATTFEIYWTNSKVYFVIGDEVLHTYSASATTWAATMNFHAFMKSVNSGASTTVDMNVRTATIYRLGKINTSPIGKNLTAVNTSQILKYGAGMLHRIIVGTPVNNKTVSVYDNVTGTGNPIIVLTLPNSATPFVMEMGVPFFTGLNVVPNDTGLNINVVYE